MDELCAVSGEARSSGIASGMSVPTDPVRTGNRRILVHDYAGHAFPVQLSRTLARRGHQVLHAYASCLQTPRGELQRRGSDPSEFEVREISMDVDYVRYKYSFVRRRRMEIDYGRNVARLIHEWKPDVVLSGNTPTETQSAILRATQLSGGKFLHWLQDVYSLAVDKLVRRKIPVLGVAVGRYYRRLDRRQFHQSDQIVAITKDFVPLLASEFGVQENRVTTIPNWAPLESVPALSATNSWSATHGLDGKFVFLYSGTLGMKHNPALLLELAETYRDDPVVQVVVVSEGIGIEWLRGQKEQRKLDNLQLFPFQPFAEMCQVLATSSVLIAVLDEQAGTFSVPSKVLSYLCARRPILLAVPEDNLAARIVVDENAGLVVHPSSEQEFLAAAQRLRADPALRHLMADNARNYAERTFDIEQITDRFESMFDDLHVSQT